MSSRNRALSHTTVLAFAVSVACQSGEGLEPGGEVAHSPARAKSGDQNRTGEPPLRIAPSSEWERVSSPDAFMVSPRWSASGEWLLMSGRMGTGLFARNLATREYAVVDSDYLGPAEWLRDRDVVCMKERETGAPKTFDARRLRVAGDAEGACVDTAWDEDLGGLIHREAGEEWYHHAKDGRVSLKHADGSTETMVRAEAWGVHVAPGGGRVTYSIGSLEDPTLFVLDVDAGETRVIGRGAYPVWMPNGRLLIFASPGERAPFGPETATFDSAEFLVYDAGADELHLLTETPEVAEMEPAISPDGTRIAFSDWQSGTIYVAELRAGGAQ